MELLWSPCEEREFLLVTHVVGAAGRAPQPRGLLIDIVEVTGWLSWWAIWWLILAGVFERHPGLKLVVTETRELVAGHRPRVGVGLRPAS